MTTTAQETASAATAAPAAPAASTTTAAAAAPDAAAGQRRRYDDRSDWPVLAIWSERLRVVVDRMGRFGAWMVLPLVGITVMDVCIRKVGKFQVTLVEIFGRFFDSTVLQELEWHFHTGLFALVLGYGYIWNTHVRVDLIREHLAFRKKAWMELIGLTVFLIPYTCIVVYFAVVYAVDSFLMNEISASTVGLTHRWIIKSVLVVGLVFVLIAGVSVLLQVLSVLFGPQDLRYPLMTIEWPEEQGSKIEGKERLDLSKAEDVLRARAAQSGHLRDSGGSAAAG